MVKAYLRYRPEGTFGVINSPSANVLFDRTGTFAISACLQDVLVHRWCDEDNTSEVTFIETSHTDKYAVGYGDGSIRLWTLSGTLVVTLRGHSSGISALCFEGNLSLLLASGSRDGDIVVWDLNTETGLARLKSHRLQITKLAFLENSNVLISASKDTFIKFWDVSLQHCFETVAKEHHFEIGSFVLLPNSENKEFRLLITGSVDSKLRMFKIMNEFEFTSSNGKIASYYGSIERKGKEKVVSMEIDCTGTLIYVHSYDKTLELYRILDEKALKMKMARRKRRQKEKSKNGVEEMNESILNGSKYDAEYISSMDVEGCLVPGEELTHLGNVRLDAGKIRSCAFSPILSVDPHGQPRLSILVSTFQNSILLYAISKNSTIATDTSTPITIDNCASIENQGHRSEIKFVSLNYDSSMLLSGSSSELKIWDINSKTCFRSIGVGAGISQTCGFFNPSGEYFIVSASDGFARIYELSSGECIESIKCHDAAINAIVPNPNGFISGSADGYLRFWEFVTVPDSRYENTERPSFLALESVKMTDDVLRICISSDNKYVAAALLDCTVKIIFRDSLKFYLSLYGHKLPITSMDISPDCTLIITASADKNIRIWGLDFGDCHRSIFCHDEALTRVVFVPKTHYFFTSSKDRLIKYWDGDKFENIVSMKGHFSEVSWIDISKDGMLLVSCGSSDRSIRLWMKSNEQIFLEEEREKEAEERFEQELIKVDSRSIMNTNPDDLDTEDVNESKPIIKTLQNIKVSEKVYELVQLASEEMDMMEKNDTTFQRSPLLQAYALGLLQNGALIPSTIQIPAELVVLRMIERIPWSDLEQAVMLLPLICVISLLRIIRLWILNGWAPYLSSRLTTIVLNIHSTQIVHHKQTRLILTDIKEKGQALIKQERDLIGLNVSHLKKLEREYYLSRETEFIDDSLAMEKLSLIKRKVRSFSTV